MMSGFLTAGVAHDMVPKASSPAANGISNKVDNLSFIRLEYYVRLLFVVGLGKFLEHIAVHVIEGAHIDVVVTEGAG